jgi:hypothetical protein
MIRRVFGLIATWGVAAQGSPFFKRRYCSLSDKRNRFAVCLLLVKVGAALAGFDLLDPHTPILSDKVLIIFILVEILMQQIELQELIVKYSIHYLYLRSESASPRTVSQAFRLAKLTKY